MEPNHSIKSSFSCNGVSAEEVDYDVNPSCNICGDLPEWVEMDKERGICHNCADHMDEGLDYYTEEFAHASLYGKDALSLFVLRQRADNCRDTIALEADSYDGYLELHETSLELLNKRAAECLARLPASFAPWWRDAWTHEKWCQVYDERKAAGWPLASADVPIVQRLAAAAVAKEDKMHEMKKAHAEVLANIERARKEDMEAVEARHKREMDKVKAEVTTVVREGFAEAGEAAKKITLDAHRRGYAMGYAFADQKWNPIYKAVCEELAAAQKELSGWCERCVAAQNAAETLRKKLDAEVAAAADDIYRAMRSDLEEMRAENNELKKENDALLDLVGHTQKLMVSNPELFGGEARGTSSSRPPPIIRLPPNKEEDNDRALNLLKDLVAPSRLCGAVESPPMAPPGLEEAGPSTDHLYMALTEEEYQKMVKAEAPPPLPPSPPPSPLLVPEQPTACGAAGCIDCPPAEPVGCEKPKPDYNHPFWPSPTTKRLAKHIAKYAGKDPKTIKTHQEALDFIAKRAKCSVEFLLGMSMKTYQSLHEPWSLAEDPWSLPSSLYFRMK